MKKLFAVMLLSFLLTSVPIISTEKDTHFSAASTYQLAANVVTDTIYFNNLPANPYLSQDTVTYKDADLSCVSETLKKGTALSIVSLSINDKAIPVFKLSTGDYLEANHQFVFDDIVLSQETVSMKYWLNKDFTVYKSPYVNGVATAQTNLTAYSQVDVTKKAITNHGTYYYIADKGWVSQDDLSETDNRMENVQNMLTQKYNNTNYSIYVKQLSTQKTAGINADKEMYSASIAKLATLYYTQEQIKTGDIKLSDSLTYSQAVQDFKGAYDPSGSGDISKTADNKDYTVETLLKAVAQKSDNVATNILGYYIAHSYDEQFSTVVDALTGTHIDMEGRNMSAKSAAYLMEAIYEQNGEIIDYLSTTDFDGSRISRDISAKVAHKIGDAYDYKHDVAIVYADEPFILSIFTNDASYDDISNIANDVYAILK